ncbi:protein-L-isoaspartate(D-aspartate) O-methyltransferase [Patescibacteria group bacterium]|nr:protein-L-isoaspartate(D-aspartate) O-methyltransferase [Patescibacteria group bacterium]MBU0777435.1 protein-L-isoaspartate(D-aspartate) O-methyltransferase [Patescibacteria group bacterium]MBU0846070.1 protein-L-isoaspartate(D-aspartate) O-methyltransferase [Patescibacteria group bacterium]MBU0923123.1 protein-L-isoaspartate(D-aspartate) O-methyltransferase [Patescibacteria group bacterium]MBU1066838.1 protein-L-isoaspartate(D-aspartate) O-methyltransferase [Patescibacteria group bacterium
MNPREKMVWEIKTRYDLDSPSVFSAMLQVPRDKFSPKEYRHSAYGDSPVPIGHGQTMSQPYTVAFMTDLLNLKGKERVLEIGTGSGYQAAILSLLAKEVFTIEIIEDLARKARKKLAKLNFKNVYTKAGTGGVGWLEKAPFDAILVTAGIEGEVPQVLFDQLKEGGVLVAPVGKGSDKMMTKFFKGEDRKIKKEEHGIFHFVPFVRK